MSFEESLIRHASPTLASIKVANLYSFKFSSAYESKITIDYFNAIMNPKGIYVELLKCAKDFCLIYVYRKSQLLRELCNLDVCRFLQSYGYDRKTDLGKYLQVLKQRLCEGTDFPHEIGVFLGYPLEDVKSFIATKGQNCIFCGEWKVYHDPQVARCKFCKYKRCKEVYVNVYEAGRCFKDMLVSC